MARSTYFDIEGITRQWADRIKTEAVAALEDTAREGAAGVREIIHLAVTPWGEARQAGLVHGPHGTSTPRPHAGRIEGGTRSEDMIGSVDSRVDDEGGDVWEAHWGWEDPAFYFLVQEYGRQEFNTAIVPMESLSRTLDAADADYRARLRDIARRGL